MYNFLALLSGVIIAIMVQMNGSLGVQFGVYHAALYTHIVGSVFGFLSLLLANKRNGLFVRKIPVWMYLGGVIGVATTVCNNLAFSHISLTSIIALSLFAQLVLSGLIDSFGWFGMMRQKDKGTSIPAVLLSVAGIILMLDTPTPGGFWYVLFSLAAGVAVVLSRTVNARLSEHIGALEGSLINHLVGLPFCLLLAHLVPEVAIPGRFTLWPWLGGVLGIATVALCNITVPKIPAYRLTLLSFCGQLFCGIIFDLLSGNALNEREFVAGLLVGAGIVASQFSVIRKRKKEEREKAYFERIRHVEKMHQETVIAKYGQPKGKDQRSGKA